MLQRQKQFFISITQLILASLLLVTGLNYLEQTKTTSQLALAAPTSATTDAQKALQQVAYAYYRRGPSLQYNGPKRHDFIAPEQITEQNSSYTVCSGFTRLVYYEALGIKIPPYTMNVTTYARQYYQNPSNPDVVYYRQGVDSVFAGNDSNAKKQLISHILNTVQPGDIFNYSDAKFNGHSTLIYDLVYRDGKPIKAIVLHSDKNNVANIVKNNRELSWHNKLNPQTNVIEGSIQMVDLQSHITKYAKYMDQVSVLRPTALGSDVYNKVSCRGGDDNMSCSSQKQPYVLTSNSRQRLTYPDLKINKTASQANGATIKPGESISYYIDVTNHSDSPYPRLSVVENFSPDLVKLQQLGGAQISASNRLTWMIDQLQPGESRRLSYVVLVKPQLNNVGAKIVSTGTVADIPSATISNSIANKLSIPQQQQLAQAYQQLNNRYSGAELIDRVYQAVLNKDYGFRNLQLGAQLNRLTEASDIKAANQVCSPYFRADGRDALIQTFYGNRPDSIALNDDNPFTRMILNNYYSALYTGYYLNNCHAHQVIQKNWQIYSPTRPDYRHPRATIVNPQSLTDGDVLLYLNNNDTVTKEAGLYAFIYLNGNFHGVNRTTDGASKNLIRAVNDRSADNLLTLYGKDYFAIFRPASALAFDPTEFAEQPSTTEQPQIDHASHQNALQHANRSANKIDILLPPNSGYRTWLMIARQLTPAAILGLLWGGLWLVKHLF